MTMLLQSRGPIPLPQYCGVVGVQPSHDLLC
jgi:hypothetical protein